MKKLTPGAALVALRWGKTSKEQRKAVSDMMLEARRKKKEQADERDEMPSQASDGDGGEG